MYNTVLLMCMDVQRCPNMQSMLESERGEVAESDMNANELQEP